MTAYYVGVKRVMAWPEEKDGKAGYSVRYEDGYVSWSPEEVFERSYFELTDPEGDSLKENDINRFIKELKGSEPDPKTTMVRAELITGFMQYETSSCVDPKNYDAQIGAKICTDRIKNEIWKLLGFVLQWSKNGLIIFPKG